ncbi:putative methyltransferase-domain-containing protein [Dichomitus squalens]|uniref:Putative methyltransferase-domain-containing protein n=1 Tax=Dichomitus squalens TaxID=114155 RepID=A0A4V2K4T8_9APHY|nr:putative methyltransferase-domain-containing protein [Dichomitus squalens]TBU62786.1 putative methyltransferase-domain-containing protein [Dichomitus squalens]
MTPSYDPNFPADLNIKPLEASASDADARFNSTAQEGAIRTYGIAGRIWEASHAMLAYLDPSSSSTCEFDPAPFTRELPRAERHPITAIELGSGTGFVASRVAEWLRPDLDLLLATDLPEVCALLEANLRSSRAARVRPLSWGSREHASAIFDELGLLSSDQPARYATHILCSDLVYFPELLAPLLRSLLHLTSPPLVGHHRAKPPTVIISYKIRSLAKETPFWTAFGLWFVFAPVLVRRKRCIGADPPSDLPAEWAKFSPGDGNDETFVLVATRRPESLSWTVPDEDAALMRGVGAQGSGSAKSDEQFEQLLLMGLDL